MSSIGEILREYVAFVECSHETQREIILRLQEVVAQECLATMAAIVDKTTDS